jgi:NADH-quinone oxidoreductase subunit N
MSGFNPTLFLFNLAWIKPELLLVLVGFVLLGAAVFGPKAWSRYSGALALLGLVLTALLVVSYLPEAPFGGPKLPADGAAAIFPDTAGHPSFVVDGFAIVFKLIFLLGAALTVLMSMRFPETTAANGAEFHAMVVFSVVGMLFLASGTDFITIYIGLETMALAGYILVGFRKSDRRSNEAALKYFLLGAFASGALLYGISLIYGSTGSVNLAGISEAIASGAVRSGIFLSIGTILVLVGMAFKIAAVPFHMWTPDAYEGATTPATAFLATAAKTGAFAMLLRVFLQGLDGLAGEWTPLLVLLAVASMTLGNVAALLQPNVKRMLAYSSIAHVGYALMGLIAIGAAVDDPATRAHGLAAVTIYLLVYTFANAGAFALVVLLYRNPEIGENVEDFGGLARTHPAAAAAMLVFMLSLAGIPATAGFIGKWWLFGAAIRAEYTWLAVVAVLNSVISLYYYIRVVVSMYVASPEGRERNPVPATLYTVIGLSAVLTVFIGLYPQPFIRLAQSALLPLGGL